MKRTEKYKDSYQYDDQYQQRNQRSREYQQRQQRRQSEENYRRNEPRQEYHHQNQGDYDENANRYYNDRDFRREQLLEEENEKNKKSKRWLIAIIAILLLIIGIFATKSYIDHKKESDNKQHTYNATNDVSKNYQQEVQNQSDNIKKQVEDAKNDIKDKIDTESRLRQIQSQIDKLKNNEITKEDSKLTQFYQDQVNKLKEANNAQQNNANENKVNALLDDVNNKVDDIKKKLNSILGNNN